MHVNTISGLTTRYGLLCSIFLSIRHAHGDFCKHLGIDSSTDLNDRYSNLFQNAYINRHAHTEYLKLI